MGSKLAERFVHFRPKINVCFYVNNNSTQLGTNCLVILRFQRLTPVLCVQKCETCLSEESVCYSVGIFFSSPLSSLASFLSRFLFCSTVSIILGHASYPEKRPFDARCPADNVVVAATTNKLLPSSSAPQHTLKTESCPSYRWLNCNRNDVTSITMRCLYLTEDNPSCV